MARRRSRPGLGQRLLVQGVTVWFLWLCLDHVPHVSSAVAALGAGAAWGLLAGWRFRGRVERTLRRLIRRAFWCVGIRITFAGRGRR